LRRAPLGIRGRCRDRGANHASDGVDSRVRPWCRTAVARAGRPMCGPAKPPVLRNMRGQGEKVNCLRARASLSGHVAALPSRSGQSQAHPPNLTRRRGLCWSHRPGMVVDACSPAHRSFDDSAAHADDVCTQSANAFCSSGA
jgi:hypothetical protein